MRRLAIFSFFFAGAAVCAAYLPLDGKLLPLGIGALSLLVLAWLAPGARSGRTRRAARWAAAGLAAGFLWAAGYSAVFWAPAQRVDGTTIRLAGTVMEWPQERDHGWSVLVKMKTEEGVTVPTLLFADEQAAELRPGDRIETVARCSLADRSSSGEEITYYTAKGIFLTAKAYGRLDWIRPERIPAGTLPAYWSQALKESIDRVFPKDVAPLVRALVTGNRDNLTDQFTTSLQRTGLSHTVAVSGMHLAFLAGLISTLLGGSRRLTSLVVIPVSILFTLVAGCTPSVVRAAVMIVLLQLAPLFRRERDSLTALGTALFLLLLYNPFSAAHIGLQLSFGAVAGILLCADRLQSRLLPLVPFAGAGQWTPGWFLRKAGVFVVSTFSATVGASLFTTPLVAIYFGSVSLIAPLSNLATLWAVGILFGAGLLLGVLGLLCLPLAAALSVPADWLARYLNWAINGLARAPFSAVTMQSVYYCFWVVFLYLLVLLALVIPGKKSGRVPVCAGVCTLCLAMLCNSWNFWQGSGSVTALNVGQGECILVRNGKFLALVDCGGSGYDSAGDIAADYLGDYGVQRLDLLVVTHFHADHANGAAQLLNRVEVGTVVLPDVEEDAPLRQELLQAAEDRNVPVLLVQNDTTLELDGGRRIRIFAPLGAGETNEEGLTFLSSQGNFDVLITGDMGTDVEQKLLAHTDLPHVEVLTVGHHGSKYSSSPELLEQIGPDFALISVGENNTYGHPDTGTVDRLLDAGAKVYRTDLYGTVTIKEN